MPNQLVDHQNSPVDAQKVSAPPALAGPLLAVVGALQFNFLATLRRRDSRMKMTSAVGNMDPERLKRRDSDKDDVYCWTGSSKVGCTPGSIVKSPPRDSDLSLSVPLSSRGIRLLISLRCIPGLYCTAWELSSVGRVWRATCLGNTAAVRVLVGVAKLIYRSITGTFWDFVCLLTWELDSCFLL